MALRKCRECGKDVSTNAKKCPNCGASQEVIIQGIAALITLGVFIWIGSIFMAAHKEAKEKDALPPGITQADIDLANKVIDENQDLPQTIADDPQKLMLALCIGVNPYSQPPPNLPHPTHEQCNKLINSLPSGNDAPTKQSFNQEYQNSQETAYEALRHRYLDDTRVIWFAVGCHVIPMYAAWSFYSEKGQELAHTQMNELPKGWDPDMKYLEDKAKREGAGMAWDTKHHVCDYWRTHPNDLYTLRRTLEAAE